MAISFNDAERQSTGGGGSLIPAGTVAPVSIHLRGIKRSDKGATGLDLEFIVTEGEFVRKKAWKWSGITGDGSEGHDTMIKITRAFIRAVLESARGVNPADDSNDAAMARAIEDWTDLNGMVFLARFDIEPGKTFTDPKTGEVKDGKDKNTVFAVTPDDPDYAGFKPQGVKRQQVAGNGAAAGGIKTPTWGARQNA